MDIPQGALADLIARYRACTGREITEREAHGIAEELFRVYRALFLPDDPADCSSRYGSVD